MCYIFLLILKFYKNKQKKKNGNKNKTVSFYEFSKFRRDLNVKNEENIS